MIVVNNPARYVAEPAFCQPADAVLNLVYIDGPKISGIPQVATVDMTDEAKQPIYGVIIAKTSPTDCLVQTEGILITPFALVPNEVYFASLSGTLTNVAPTAPPAGFAIVQPVGLAIDTNQLRLIPTLYRTKKVA